MKIKVIKYLILAMTIIFAVSFSACGDKSDNGSDNGQVKKELSGSLELVQIAIEVANELKTKDLASLSEHINPDKGLVIAPYSNIDLENSISFTKEEFAALKDSPNQFTWGSYDGSGEPILLNFSDYYNLFIFDADFTIPDLIGVNENIGAGNTINNLMEVFPNSEFIEFHIKGIDPQYDGMDWRSLRLGFEKIDNKYFLIYIAHDQWTI
jgi:hypothetical protein